MKAIIHIINNNNNSFTLRMYHLPIFACPWLQTSFIRLFYLKVLINRVRSVREISNWGLTVLTKRQPSHASRLKCDNALNTERSRLISILLYVFFFSKRQHRRASASSLLRTTDCAAKVIDNIDYTRNARGCYGVPRMLNNQSERAIYLCHIIIKKNLLTLLLQVLVPSFSSKSIRGRARDKLREDLCSRVFYCLVLHCSLVLG